MEATSSRREFVSSDDSFSKSVLPAPMIAESGVRKSCETALSKRIAHPLGFDIQADLIGFRFEVGAFQSQGDESGERLQKVDLAGIDRFFFKRDHAQHADDSAGSGKRQIDAFGTGKRRRSASRRLTVLVNPFRDGLIVGVKLKIVAVISRRKQFSLPIRQKHDRANIGGRHDVRCGDPRDLLPILRCRQLPADGVKGRHPPFLPPCRFDLKLHPGRQGADGQAGQQHDQKREQVLRIADGKSPAGRHETKIEHGNAEQRR